VSPLDLPPSKELLRQEYVGRINRVIDYIEENIDTELSLETLAKVASFSRFHFHRIFSALVGETLNGFVRRLRLERAASMLIAHPKETITAIARSKGRLKMNVEVKEMPEMADGQVDAGKRLSTRRSTLLRVVPQRPENPSRG
jgi:methylphosphotriester-DNA--protein-cysteine methyltransferase